MLFQCALIALSIWRPIVILGSPFILSRRFPSLLWSDGLALFHAFLFLGLFTLLYLPGASWERGLFAIFKICLSECILFFQPSHLIHSLACYRNLGWKWASFVLFKILSSVFWLPLLLWQSSKPFWLLISCMWPVFFSLSSCRIFLILKEMKFHNYAGGIFSPTVLGNPWAPLMAKFMSFSSEKCSLLHVLCVLSLSGTFTVGLLDLLDSSSHFLLFVFLFSTVSFLLYCLGIPSTFYTTLLLSFSLLICCQYPRIIFVSKHYFL